MRKLLQKTECFLEALLVLMTVGPAAPTAWTAVPEPAHFHHTM